MIALAVLGLALASVPERPPNAVGPETWREARRCGPNTLHAFLNLHGHRVPLETIDARVPVGPDGATMADLACAATELGLPSRVVRSAPDRLGDWLLPAIAHLHVQEGHYVLVLRVTDDEVTTADLTSGEIRSMPADSFQELWSGYLLVAGTGNARRAVIFVGGSIVAVAFVFLLWRRPTVPPSETAASPGKARRAAGLLGVASVVLAVCLALRLSASGRPVTPAPILTRPVPIAPLWLRDGVASEALSPVRWRAISAKLRPDRTLKDIGHLVHQWENGADEEPLSTGSETLTAGMMEGILLDGDAHDLFAVRRPLIHIDAFGRPRISRYGEAGSEAHAHQVLASCAAMGIQSDRLVRAGDASVTIADLVRTARDDFHLKGEVEWTAMALARYAPTRAPWTNRWGKTFDFDAIAEHFLGLPLGEGTCAGTHGLQALAVMLRVHAVHPLFRPEVARRVRARLEEAVARLAASQRPDGSWTPDWPFPLADPASAPFDDLLSGPARQAQMTGHHLEWLQLLPEELTLPPDRCRRAVSACVAALERASTDDVWAELCPYSHCYRIARRYAAPEAVTQEDR
jgi:hypothetical protein